MRTIRSKLLLLFALLAGLPMVGIGVASYVSSLSSIQAVVENRAVAAASAAADEFYERFAPRLAEVSLLARNREIQDLYAGIAGAGPQAEDSHSPGLNAFFRHFFNGPREAFTRVLYFDRDGRLLFACVRNASVSFKVDEYSFVRTDSLLDAIERELAARTGGTLAFNSSPASELGKTDKSERSLSFDFLPAFGSVIRIERSLESIDTGERVGTLVADLSKATMGDLRKLTGELEDRVRQRTAELEEVTQTVQGQN